MTGLAREYGEGLYELARDEDLGLLIFEQLDDICAILKAQPGSYGCCVRAPSSAAFG